MTAVIIGPRQLSRNRKRSGYVDCEQFGENFFLLQTRATQFETINDDSCG